MITIRQKIRLLLWISAGLMLCACSSNKHWDKGEGVTMAQVYETQMRQNNQNTLQTVRGQLATDTNNSNVAPNNLSTTNLITADSNDSFMLLPNPTIALYVYPHLVNGNIPVPGYTTQFTLYTEVHYALPGEVAISTSNTGGM